MAKKKSEKNISKIDKLFLSAQQKLSISNCSIKKMKEYLFKKGGNKKEIEEVLTKLKKYSFLDEDEIIKNVISYSDSKHYGYNKIIEMLKQKEIDYKKIESIKLNPKREEKESLELVKRLKKRYKNKNTVNLKRSIYSALIRYGYEQNIASVRASEVFNILRQEFPHNNL